LMFTLMEILCSWQFWVAYVLIHIYTFWWALNEIKPFITKNEERDAKYPGFSRTDKDSFNWGKLPLCFTFWIRFGIIAVIILIYTIWVKSWMLGHTLGTPVARWRRIMTKLPG